MALCMRHPSRLMGVWRIEESIPELLARMENPDDFHRKFPPSHTAGNRQKEWLAIRVLLRELLGHEARIAYHPNGAPYLPDEPFHISISHTRGFAAVLLSEQTAGIDIEHQSERIKNIRQRFMSEKEEQGIDPAHETEHLLLHWCAKETLFKMIGQEQVDFQKHLHIEAFPYQSEGSFSAWETRSPRMVIVRLDYLVTPEFVLTFSR